MKQVTQILVEGESPNLIADGNSDQKSQRNRKCVIIQILKFNNYKNCLLNNEMMLKSKQRFRSETHNAYVEEINKVALNSTDGERLQTFDKNTSYPHGANIRKVCKTKLLNTVFNRELLILMMLLMKI